MTVDERRIAVLGTGRIGEALIAGLLSSGWREPAEIAASSRREERVAELVERYGVRATTSNVEAAAGASLVVVSVKPQDIDALLGEIGTAITPEQTVLTVAAATPAATIPDEAAVFRVGVEDAASVAIATVGRLGMPDLSFDGRWLLAPVLATDGQVRVLSAAVDGRPAPSPAAVDVVRAGPGEAPPAARPIPQLRIQP